MDAQNAYSSAIVAKTNAEVPLLGAKMHADSPLGVQNKC